MCWMPLLSFNQQHLNNIEGEMVECSSYLLMYELSRSMVIQWVEFASSATLAMPIVLDLFSYL